jgi:phosphopantothenoylcysteine decarboxylase/phosphopantothenate--cysteine ligase
VAESSKTLILGVTASVAIYKSLDLIRELQKRGFDVECVMTPDATRFVQPLMFASLLGKPVWVDPFSEQMPHIRLSRAARMIVVAPATMNFISKYALGISDNLLLSLCQATQVPVLLAPAMNPEMYRHPTTQKHLAWLKACGVHVQEPEEGLALCGETGPGKMASLEALVGAIERRVTEKLAHPNAVGSAEPLRRGGLEGGSDFWVDLPVLVTAGPTRNYLDPIRFISNASSGKLGAALAEALSRRGARVTLSLSRFSEARVSETLELLQGRVEPIKIERFGTHAELGRTYQEFIRANTHGCIFAAAAPSDFEVRKPSGQKKSKLELRRLHLSPLPDLLVTHCADRPVSLKLVGFCAETHDFLIRGKQKMLAKHCDFMWVNGPDAFGSEALSGYLLGRAGEQAKPVSLQSKAAVADQLLDFIEASYADL